MNILLLGSGGRENAFAWKIVNSPKCNQLFVAPGNAGTAQIATNIAVPPTDFEGLAKFISENHVALIVVGPEEPLVKGVSDYFKNHPTLSHLPVVGPPKLGAQLEGSKDFSKRFMQRHGIPTAGYETFTKDTFETGLEYLRSHSLPIVLKADGLAAGKGVLICTTREEAIESFEEMILQSKFGAASDKVVVEEFLDGIELSVFVATDGVSYKILPEAKDYKRIGESDTGLNTGGMGAVSPVPFADAAFLRKVEERIVKPTVTGLKKDNIPFVGFLFIGLMNIKGNPYVIEYNVRMGDPETEAVLPRIGSDFVDLLLAMGTQTLEQYKLEILPHTCTTVVMVAGGYPGDYAKGLSIQGLSEASKTEGAKIFHAGTKQGENGTILTNGGRVLAITGLGNSIEEALENAYTTISKITWEGAYFRRDIGQDVLKFKN
jgi:phosphoribosylamine--glycine ligase